ncbi:MAG: hypothetical protein WCJ09_24870 [Planctomycetota bacterium]
MSRASINDLQNHSLGRTSTATLPPVSQRIWGVRNIVNKLGPCECRRRLLHMLPGLMPAWLLVIPHQDPWGPLLIGIVVAMSIAIVAFAIRRESDFARPNESQWHHSVMGYTIPVVALLLLLPGRSEIGLMTLGILAFGDGSAALGGKMIGGYRLPWNRRKTWAGLFCFVTMGTLVASFNYWIDAKPVVSYGVALSIASVAAMAGAFVESLPIRSHDNFRVGVTSALTGLLMHTYILGW